MSLQNFRIHKRLSLNPETVEEIYAIISEVEGVKNSWQITKQLLPQTIERLTRCVIITSTGSSNRIEGNKLTDNQVENLYKNLDVQKFKTRDEQEIAGYLQCLELIFNNYDEIHITKSFILKLHNDMLIYSDKDIRHKGNYKFASNRVEAKDYDGNIVGVIFEPTPPYLVKKEMQELIDWYNLAVKDKAKHPLILIANFIFEYLAIHPFQDGNGRTSRLLTNLLLLKHGYLFTQIVSHERIIEENKVDYYKALNKTQSHWKKEAEDITAWLKFFLNVVKLQSTKALQIIKEDNIEYLLSEKQLLLWNWINKENKEFSRKDAVSALNFPERTVESIIKKLVDLKRLKSIGQGKATRYKLK
ncbi:Fic family protein [Rickettsia endosymbiont of Lasioglossum villosulum]|uniref:Fic family protein n=1 Tax=Rickettsia endosymbiont of Lasioglossum villosulum TaxID=3066269 RepID=UPI0031329D74